MDADASIIDTGTTPGTSSWNLNAPATLTEKKI
jgi:hypothetical protein